MTLIVAQIKHDPTLARSVNNELEKIWKDTDMI
jgi:hypothetical protein